MKKYRFFGYVCIAFFFVFFVESYCVQAHEPRVVEFKVTKSNKSGTIRTGAQRSGDDLVKVDIFALKDDALNWILVVFPGVDSDPKIAGKPVENLDEIIDGKNVSPKYSKWEDPGPIWQMYTGTNQILIPPGDSISIKVIVDFLRSENGGVSPRLFGKAYLVDAKDVKSARGNASAVAQLVHNQQPAAQIIIDLYYRISEGKWRAGSFEDVFGKPSEDEIDVESTEDYDKNASQLPVVTEDYRSSLEIPGDLEDDGGALFKQTLEEVFRLGSGEDGDKFCDEEDIKLSPKVKTRSSHSLSHSLSGKFSSKWASDHSLHPGFGWRVEAWTNENSSWVKLASDWVHSDGTWELEIPDALGFQGNHLRMYYRAFNSYYKPQDEDGNTYSWRDPDQFNIGNTFNAGHRYADTDGGTANGLGDLYDAAYEMWSRLYWNGGLNPVPSSPLAIFYPNTFENCGGSSPWSCADTSGNIWLIPTHGTQAPVVVHELSHQLNNKFWDNKRPANSGGSHNLSSCYPTRLGMTLREGFADFMPGWVGYQNRNVAEGGFTSTQWNLGYDIETRNAPPNCANGWEAELWVSRTFWDLNDTRSDGDDILWFIHKGAVISLFLSNGPANDGDALDMRDFEDVYRNAATPGHEDFISDIFDQNRQ